MVRNSFPTFPRAMHASIIEFAVRGPVYGRCSRAVYSTVVGVVIRLTVRRRPAHNVSYTHGSRPPTNTMNCDSLAMFRLHASPPSRNLNHSSACDNKRTPIRYDYTTSGDSVRCQIRTWDPVDFHYRWFHNNFSIMGRSHGMQDVETCLHLQFNQ